MFLILPADTDIWVISALFILLVTGGFLARYMKQGNHLRYKYWQFWWVLLFLNFAVAVMLLIFFVPR